LTTSVQSFNNPLYKSDEAEINQNNEKHVSGSDDNVSTSFYSTCSLSKADSGKLDKLGEANEVEAEADVVVNTSRQNKILLKILVAQEKQLYWIRIIGIPFLFAAIGTFLALIIRAIN